MAVFPQAYAQASQYREVVGNTDPAKEDEIMTDLVAISRFLDRKLERFFGKDSEPVARIYMAPSNCREIWVDDLSELPGAVTIDDDRDGLFDDDPLEPTDFELLPLNAPSGPEQRPFTRLALTSWGSRRRFRAGDRVQIVARFGWPAVPPAIQRATIHLAAILRLDTPRATRRIPELGDAIEASPDAQSIIRQLTNQYQRVTYV